MPIKAPAGAAVGRGIHYDVRSKPRFFNKNQRTESQSVSAHTFTVSDLYACVFPVSCGGGEAGRR